MKSGLSSYILDTDIIIYWMNNKYPNIRRKIENIPDDNIFISAITVAELYFGAYNSSRVQENCQLLDELVPELNVISFDKECGKTFGKIKSDLKSKGEIINDSDLFIASIVLTRKLILVTNNDKHFKRIKGIKLENW